VNLPDLEEDLRDIIASVDTIATRRVVTGSQQQGSWGSLAPARRSGSGHKLRPPQGGPRDRHLDAVRGVAM